MLSVKILPKGQITLPKEIRKRLDVHDGDTLVIETRADEIVLKKGKTIFDYSATLPDLGLTLDEMREKAVIEAMHDIR